jgi:hypothetical protein
MRRLRHAVVQLRLASDADLARRSTATSVSTSISLCVKQDVVARQYSSDLKAALSVTEYWLQVRCGIRFFSKSSLLPNYARIKITKYFPSIQIYTTGSDHHDNRGRDQNTYTLKATEPTTLTTTLDFSQFTEHFMALYPTHKFSVTDLSLSLQV